MSNSEKLAALTMISTINAVEGFDPTTLAVEYTDMNTRETRLRLPVMAQVAWFRLKYPEGRFTITVSPAKDCFVASARVYKHYMDPPDCFLAEASASRGYMPDKPTVSPREWAQTAALGIALRNAGFGLQFHAAGESFDDPAVQELERTDAPTIGTEDAGSEYPSVSGAAAPLPGDDTLPEKDPSPEEPEEKPEENPLERAKKLLCPITKYKEKTLGEMILTP